MQNPFEEITQRLDKIEELLEKLSAFESAGNFDNTQDMIGDISLAEKVTGLARATIYGLICKKKIPHFKKGKKLFFSKHELINWIKDGRQPTKSDLYKEVELSQIRTCHKRK